MKQYTTEYAKEYLREHDEVLTIAQDEDLEVYGYTVDIGIESKIDDDCWYCNMVELGKMLEHPDGWENSKVTREEI